MTEVTLACLCSISNTTLTCLSKSLGLTMALLVMVSVSLGHFDTFIRLLDIFLEGEI